MNCVLFEIVFFVNLHSTIGRGCAAAALRLWLEPNSDVPPIELCGEKALNDHWQYITLGQTARLSFTSADKAIGAQVSRGIKLITFLKLIYNHY